MNDFGKRFFGRELNQQLIFENPEYEPFREYVGSIDIFKPIGYIEEIKNQVVPGYNGLSTAIVMAEDNTTVESPTIRTEVMTMISEWIDWEKFFLEENLDGEINSSNIVNLIVEIMNKRIVLDSSANLEEQQVFVPREMIPALKNVIGAAYELFQTGYIQYCNNNGLKDEDLFNNIYSMFQQKLTMAEYRAQRVA